MAINYPGPLQMRIFYSVSSVEHQLQLNCIPAVTPEVGDLFNEINLVGRNGTNYLASTVLGQLLTVLEPLFSLTETSFDRAELWAYAPGTFDATYISSNDISDAGSSGTAPVPAGQQIFTFRTQEGGVMRLTLMEGTEAPGQSQGYASMSALNQALVTHVNRPEGVWVGRDTSYPVAFMKHHPGTNEAVFKRRYRS